MRRGETIGSYGTGLLCTRRGDLTWRGGRVTISDEEFSDQFRAELTNAGYTVVGNPDALFEDPAEWKAEFLVAGLVRKIQTSLCVPSSSVRTLRNAKGEGSIEVNWQIYHRLDRKVVLEITTNGYGSVAEPHPNGAEGVIQNAFAQGTRALLAEPRFHALVTGPQEPARPALREPLAVTGRALFAGEFAANADAVRDNVVTVFAGRGHGSGFFVGQGRLSVAISRRPRRRALYRVAAGAGASV